MQKGFTLIELVLVIAILGVLAVAALPSLFNVSLTAARTNAMNATVGAIQTGITLYASSQIAAGSPLSYPTTLDSVTGGTPGTPVAATNSVRFFTAVTQNGISAQWFKISANGATIDYAHDTDGTGTFASGSTTDTCFRYTASAGTFVNLLPCP